MDSLAKNKKSFGRKDLPLVDHLLSFQKTLKEILVGHTTLFGEIRKVSTFSGSARSIAVVFQPFMSYFNSFYPSFVKVPLTHALHKLLFTRPILQNYYEGIMPDQLGKTIADSEVVKSLFDVR